VPAAAEEMNIVYLPSGLELSNSLYQLQLSTELCSSCMS